MTYYYEKDFLLKKGYLTLKKVGFIGIKKYLLLCAPVSITDVAVVYENLFSLEGKYKIESKAIPFLGNNYNYINLYLILWIYIYSILIQY